MNKLAPVVLIAMLAFGQLALAQTTVSGEVKNSEGEPLIGVLISIKGTTTATVTDTDGKYQISVTDSGVQLLFQYAMHVTQEVSIDDRDVIDIEMELDTESLQNAVIANNLDPVRIVESFNGPTTDWLNNIELLSTVRAQHIFREAPNAVPDAFSGQPDLRAFFFEGEPYIAGFWSTTGSAIAVNMITGGVLALIDGTIQDFDLINGVYFNYLASQQLSAGDSSRCPMWTDTPEGSTTTYFNFEFDSSGETTNVQSSSENWTWVNNDGFERELNRLFFTQANGVDQILDVTERFTLDDQNGFLSSRERTAEIDVYIDGEFQGQFTETVTPGTTYVWQPGSESCLGFRNLSTTSEETMVTEFNGVTTEVNTIGPQFYSVSNIDVPTLTNEGTKNTTETYTLGDTIQRIRWDQESGRQVTSETIEAVSRFSRNRPVRQRFVRPRGVRFMVGKDF